jgi:hypothetical protein
MRPRGSFAALCAAVSGAEHRTAADRAPAWAGCDDCGVTMAVLVVELEVTAVPARWRERGLFGCDRH